MKDNRQSKIRTLNMLIDELNCFVNDVNIVGNSLVNDDHTESNLNDCKEAIDAAHEAQAALARLADRLS